MLICRWIQREFTYPANASSTMPKTCSKSCAIWRSRRGRTLQFRWRKLSPNNQSCKFRASSIKTQGQCWETYSWMLHLTLKLWGKALILRSPKTLFLSSTSLTFKSRLSILPNASSWPMVFRIIVSLLSWSRRIKLQTPPGTVVKMSAPLLSTLAAIDESQRLVIRVYVRSLWDSKVSRGHMLIWKFCFWCRLFWAVQLSSVRVAPAKECTHALTNQS